MGERRIRFRTWIAATAPVFAAVAAMALPSATSAAEPNLYTVHNLVSDEPGVAAVLDPQLVNPWGLDALAGSPWWVADNETDVSTLYRAAGTKLGLEVAIPGGAPTGLVANPTTNFVVTNGLVEGPAPFIFAGQTGVISGWIPAFGPQAFPAVNDPDSSYTGLAIATDRLYAADFLNAEVDVFDAEFDPILPGSFVDPGLPEGYAPFGIQTIGGLIYVAYAKQGEPDEEELEEVTGQSLGIVDKFDLNGDLVGRVATRGQLNAPWGIALAPANFGRFSNDLLIGNFGDGEINAYELQPDGSYERVGALRDADHKSISIDGLWAIQFGKGQLVNNGPTNTLFFTAGPDDETHGLFGSITTG
jgi:uncharacterized protein (TIGR03118 family)